ncbi:hypothetical protein Tco_0845779 [Tanacetum coccineum]
MQESDKKQGEKDLKNIMDDVDIEDLTIEQYLRLTQENQTPKKIENMTIADKCAPTHDSIREFAHYFGPNQPGAESDCDSKDMEEEHFKEKDDVDKWLNAEITKHLSIQGVENTEDALINIIKSIKKEMKDDIMKKQIELSIANIDNIALRYLSIFVKTFELNLSPPPRNSDMVYVVSSGRLRTLVKRCFTLNGWAVEIMRWKGRVCFVFVKKWEEESEVYAHIDMTTTSLENT